MNRDHWIVILTVFASALLAFGSLSSIFLFGKSALWVVGVLYGLLVASLIFSVIVARNRVAWVLGLCEKRMYDRALLLDRALEPLLGSRPGLRGVVLFHAGRYVEARAILRPFALNDSGKPVSESGALALYCKALVNDGQSTEAERLLEQAISQVENPILQVALATCLLDQQKDAERARILLECALEAPKEPTLSDYSHRADYLRRRARYAWALSSCGRSVEARSLIAELSELPDLEPEHLAGVKYFLGQAWLAMGAKQEARAVFTEVLTLEPHNNLVLSASKSLAKLDVGQ